MRYHVVISGVILVALMTGAVWMAHGFQTDPGTAQFMLWFLLGLSAGPVVMIILILLGVRTSPREADAKAAATEHEIEGE